MNRRTVLITVITLTAVLFSIATPAKVRAVRGDGLMAVVHDATLTGQGTNSQPLGVRTGQFVTAINGRTGAVSIAGGQGIAVTPSADGLFISATGSSTLGVSSLNGMTGPLTVSAGNGVSIIPSGNGFAIATSPSVSSLNGVTGPISLNGANGLNVSTNGNTITFTPPNNTGGLTLPFNVDGSYGPFALSVVNRNGTGVAGSTWGNVAAGVRGDGHTSSTFGVFGSNDAPSGVGVAGGATDNVGGIGIFGVGGRTGTYGRASVSNGTALYGDASNGAAGVYATSNGASNGYAGLFQGNVSVNGFLSKSAGSFKIDHPLDPENKYLYHSFVESPDMKNIYDGVVALGGNGEAVVRLPEWFEALNRDFRYQLTCIGGYAPVYVASEVSGNEFTIAGGRPGLRVSWQVTGIRHDRYADAHRIQVEELKGVAEQGRYLHPELYGRDQREGLGYRESPNITPLQK